MLTNMFNTKVYNQWTHQHLTMSS